MRILAIIVLLFGAALAGGGIYYANVYMDMYKAGLQSQNQGPQTVKVIVATKGMRYGHRLQPEDLRWVDWPRASLPNGVFTSRKDLFGESGKEKRIVLRAIEQDEPVLKTKVSGFGASTRLAAQLPDGMRAYTLQINSLSGVAGFIGPGDRVDVILTRQINGTLVSGVIIQDLPVIAVDQNLDKEASRPRIGSSATVEVDSRQAQKLTLAQQVGTLTLTLRGANETSTEKIEPVDLSDIDFETDRPQVKGPQFGTTVRVRRGVSLGSQRVEDSPEMLDQKRRQLEAERERVAEELRRLEEQEKQSN